MKTKWIIGCVVGTGVSLLVLNASRTAPEDFVVHEWGTFTTVHAANGERLDGLEQEEEALPGFVYQHDGMGRVPQWGGPFHPMLVRKGLARAVRNVTVKMETPVLYVYSPTAMRAHIQVGFEGGSISQWFPQRTGGEVVPRLTPQNQAALVMDFSKPYHGGIEWDVDVLAPDSEEAYTAKPQWGHEQWPAARVRDANRLKVGDEVEHMLFYRGIGNFEVPIHIRALSDTELEIQNRGTVAIPFVQVYDNRSYGQGGVWWTGALEPGQTRHARYQDRSGGSVQARTSLQQHLTEAGLFAPEASAMAQTWQRSYYEKPGLRVFWIVPREMTDRILPIQVSPAPARMERVLLGRSEVLTPGFEAVLKEAWKRDKLGHFSDDRYVTAYRNWMMKLEQDEAEKGKVAGLLSL